MIRLRQGIAGTSSVFALRAALGQVIETRRRKRKIPALHESDSSVGSVHRKRQSRLTSIEPDEHHLVTARERLEAESGRESSELPLGI
jgi:hypothetical protein